MGLSRNENLSQYLIRPYKSATYDSLITDGGFAYCRLHAGLGVLLASSLGGICSSPPGRELLDFRSDTMELGSLSFRWMEHEAL